MEKTAMADDVFGREVNRYLAEVVGTEGCRRCPYCGEGFLIPAEIVSTAERITLCEECETVWSEGEPLDETHGVSSIAYSTLSGEVGLDFADLKVF